MSSDIIYHESIVRIPASHGQTEEDLYLHMSQSGSSNCFEFGKNGNDGRRSRSWQADAFGTEKQVLAASIRTSGYIEGHSLRIGGFSRKSTPEAYIRRVRNLLAKAKQTNVLQGHSYAGESLRFSTYFKNYAVEKPERESYDFTSPEAFREFYQRYVSTEGSKLRADRFFDVYGPEMR